MRILDEISNNSLDNITIYLTSAEAKELRDSIDDLLKKPLNNHAHISDESFKKEITICIYNVNNLNGFNERSLDLIINDK
ncbi:MAG TPA: hypothetical protein PLC42_07885 [Parachlamydiaceae bacterium]|nr:hypothetical protein [Parachlamydiaceae bacterium]